MKVVHVIDSGGLYGAEIMLLSLLQEQKEIGVEPEVISIGNLNQPEKAIEAELKIRGVPVHAIRMATFPALSQSLSILAICKQLDARVIHCHGYKGNILLGILPLWIRRIPVVTTLHGYTRHKFLSKMTIYQFIDKLMIRFLEAVVLVSPALGNQIVTFGIQKKIHIVPNGIPQLDELLNTFSVKSDKFVIGSIGRLCKEKNFSFLIAMMPKVLEVIPSATLIIHGEGEEREKLQMQVQQMNLADKVIFPGYTKNPHAFLQELDVYVNCSLTEGMPITLLEAMRAKCFIAASRIPANVQLLKGKYALEMLFDFSETSFVNCLYSYVNAIDDIKTQQKQKLYDVFIESYTSFAMAKKYKEIYETLA